MSFRYELRSKREIKKMRAAGLVVWEAHQTAAKMIGAGVSTAEINQVYIDVFARHDATPLFLNYGGTDYRPPFRLKFALRSTRKSFTAFPQPTESSKKATASPSTRVAASMAGVVMRR